jgi:vacuolar-type H+-ATPase catalytic subunit A/Vma1
MSNRILQKEAPMKSLYEINEELRQVVEDAEQQAIQNDGEISLIMSLMLESLNQEREQKIGNICKYWKSLVAEAEMVKQEADVLAKRAKSTMHKAESLKNFLANLMKAGETYSDTVSKISWRKSESVEIADPSALTDEYTKVTIEPDKTKLKEAIKAGKEISGVSIVTKQNLQIK